MNVKKSIKNLGYSIFSQIFVLVLGLVVPRIIMTSYGSDTNGLLSTITQIMAYIALLEAGIGQATRNELYACFHGNIYDRSNISRIMSVSRKSYRDITKVYVLAVLVLALTLPFIIKTDLSFFTVFTVVFFEGATGAVSFYYIQNWSTLLTVDGKQYVNTNIELFNKILCYGVKIVFAILGANIVFMEIGHFIASVIKYFIYMLYMKKHYSWVDYAVNIKGQKLKDRGSYIITEIAWTIFSSTDMIVLSVFCSTKDASVYSVYNMTFVALNSLLNAVYMSLKFNLGQSFHEDIEKYEKMHDLFNSFFVGIMSSLMSVSYILCVPFVSLYTKGVNDINYINTLLPIGFCLIQILSWSRMVSGNLTGLAGYAKKVSRISLVEALTNITLSIIFVNYFGIVGVLYATVVALPLKMVYCNWLADKVIIKRSAYRTIKIIGINIGLFIVTVCISNLFSLSISTYKSFCLWGLILSIIIMAIYGLANAVVNNDIVIVAKKVLQMAAKRFN